MELLLARLTEKKNRLISLGPLPPALLKNLAAWYKIALTYSSNAIEGNTLSMQETACVVDEGLSIAGKTVVEHLEAIGHAQAIDFIIKLAEEKKTKDLCVDDVLAIHRIVFQKINSEEAGQFRQVRVRVSGSQVVLPNPVKVPELIDEFFIWLRMQQDHPVLVAARAHLKFVFIHPFIDGNGRTARLLMNLLLLQAGYPLTIIEREERVVYLGAIEKALRFDDCIDFYNLIFRAVERSLDDYIEASSSSDK